MLIDFYVDSSGYLRLPGRSNVWTPTGVFPSTPRGLAADVRWFPLEFARPRSFGETDLQRRLESYLRGAGWSAAYNTVWCADAPRTLKAAWRAQCRALSYELRYGRRPAPDTHDPVPVDVDALRAVFAARWDWVMGVIQK